MKNEIKNKVVFVSHKQAPRAILLMWRAGIPVCLIGGVGCGKTSLAEWLQKKLAESINDFKMWKVFLGLMESTDIGGFPREEKDQIIFKMLKILPWDSKEAGLINYDEFDSAAPDVQNASTQTILGGELHGHTLSPNSYVILTMNGSSDIHTTPLSEKIRNRVCFLYMSSHASGNLTAWNEWADINQVHPEVKGWMNFDYSSMKKHEDFEDLALDTPRSRSRISEVIKASDSVSFDTSDILLPCIAGMVGKAAALKFIAFREKISKLPDVDALLDGGINNGMRGKVEKIIENPIMTWALSSAIMKKVKEADPSKHKDRAVNAITIADIMPDEIGWFLSQRVIKDVPSVVSTQQHIDYFNKHQEVMI